MPKATLSKGFCAHARCAGSERKTDYFDDELPGFLLEVRATGGKTFYQRYRDDHGRERQYKLGPASVLTPAEARAKARKVAAQALLGEDPQTERRQLRAMPRLSTFANDSYLPFAKDAKRSWKTDETLLRLHILPQLGSYALDEISQPMVAQLLRTITANGYSSGTTNRILILLRYMFNLARKWGIPRLDKNPSDDLKLGPDNCRERFLTIEEAKRLMVALATDENQTAARAIGLLLLTGGRRNEVLNAQWDHIDWRRNMLLVPRSKNGRPRYIKLNSSALQLLKGLPCPQHLFIFPSPITGRPSTSLHFPWTRIRRQAGLAGLRLHDLRHSFASFLVNDGVSIYEVQKLLGHTQIKTTQRYAHLSEERLSEAAESITRTLAAA